jgi:hypothetical protein
MRIDASRIDRGGAIWHGSRQCPYCNDNSGARGQENGHCLLVRPLAHSGISKHAWRVGKCGLALQRQESEVAAIMVPVSLGGSSPPHSRVAGWPGIAEGEV